METSKPDQVADLVIDTVCDVVKCSREDVLSRTRKYDVVYARYVVMYCLYFTAKRFPGACFVRYGHQCSPFGSMEIAKIMKWDHATIVHADNRIRSLIHAYKHDREQVREITTRLAQEGFHLPAEKFLDDVDNWSKPEKFL